MIRKNKRTIIGAALMVGIALALAGKSLAAQPESPRAGFTDQFGYSLVTDTITNTGWVDAFTNGAPLTLDSNDDGLTAPINLPFSFPFYENTYSAIQVDSNGLLYFSPAISRNVNQPIPRRALPNNFIAAYWSDLFVGTAGSFNGALYYQVLGSAPNRKVVIEWYDVTRLLDISHPLTFEIILFENGNIYLQYQTLTGNLSDATAGIESSDGLDGIQFVYDSPGLVQGLALRLTRPVDNSYGLRAISGFGSSMLVGRLGQVSLSFRNVGQFSSDRYEVQFATPSDWSLLLSSETPAVSLVDTNGNGIIETTAVNSGEIFTLTLRAAAPALLSPGGFASVPITVTSMGNPGRSFSGLARFAAPTRFVYTFSDTNEFNSLGYLSPEVKKDSTLFYSLGRNHTLALTPANTYFYAWDRSYTPAWGQVSNIEFAIFNANGKVQKDFSSLYDHTKDTKWLQDSQPSLAAGSQNIGILFLRHDPAPGGVNNILFALLDSAGNLMTTTPVSLTNQTSGGSLIFSAPRLAATTDGKFIATWAVFNASDFSRNIWLAVLNPADGSILSNAALTASTSNAQVFDQPQIQALSGGRVALAYQETQLVGGNPVFSTHVEPVDSSGSPLSSGVLLAGLSTAQSTLAQTSPGGPVLMAWSGSTENQVTYLLINDSITTTSSIFHLIQPDATEVSTVGNVAAASDNNGRSILIWMDMISLRRIYYALVNADGSLATPPIILKDAGPGGAWGTNTSRLNAASFSGFFLQYMPTVQKK